MNKSKLFWRGATKVLLNVAERGIPVSFDTFIALSNIAI